MFKTYLESQPIARKSANPQISLIISCYNDSDLLTHCLKDLSRQTIFAECEIMVIANETDSKVGLLLADFHERFKNIEFEIVPDGTIYHYWNLAIKKTTAPLIANVRVDDPLHPEAFEKLKHLMDTHSEYSLIYYDTMITSTPCETFESNSADGHLKLEDFDIKKLKDGKNLLGSQQIWLRSIHDKYGYFDEFFTVSGDYEFWLRISETETIVHHAEILGMYLRRPDNLFTREKLRKRYEDNLIIQKYSETTSIYLIEKSFEFIDKRHKDINTVTTHLNNENWNEVKNIVDSYLSDYPEDQDMLYLKSTLFFRLKQPESGAEILEKLLSMNPDYSPAANNLAIWKWKNGERNEATKWMKKVVEQDPSNKEALFNLADMYEAIGKPDLAITFYKRVTEFDRFHIKALSELIRLLEKRDKVQADYYKEMLKISHSYQPK